MFLANYSDGLSRPAARPADRGIPSDSSVIASFAAVRSSQSFHAMHDGCGRTGHPDRCDGEPASLDQRRLLRACGEIFDYIQEGEELVEQPFQRLIAQRSSLAYRWMASGSAWTRSRTRSPSTAWKRGEIARGWSGSGHPAGAPNSSRPAPVTRPFDRRAQESLRILCIGAHCDESRSAAAAPCSSCSGDGASC